MLADFDAFVYFYPLRAYAAAAVQSGRLPLWNPSRFLGEPFIANPQSAFFYPLTALFFWLQVPWAYGLSLVLHVFIAGLGFYVFGRLTIGVRRPSALLGAMAFMLSGVLSGEYGHLNQLSAVAWMPLVVLLAAQAVRQGSIRLGAAGAAIFAIQLLAGHPQQSYMTLILVGIVAAWRGCGVGARGLARAAATGLGTVALGAALAAAQLLPTVELAANSIRGAGLSYREAVTDSLWPWLVARALLPSFVNDLGSTEWLGYVGVVPLALATLALGTADGRRLALAATIAAIGLFLALGAANPLYAWLFTVIPGMSSFRVPARWLLLYTFGVASLAALGLDWLLGRLGGQLSRKEWSRIVGTVLGLAMLGLAAYLGGVRATRHLQLIWLGLFALTAALAVACALPGTRRPAVGLLLAVSAVELWAAGGDLPPRVPVPIEAYAQPRDSTLFLQSRLDGGRFLSIASEEYELKETPDYREWLSGLPEQALSGFLVAAKRNEVLTPNLSLLYQLDDLDGYDGGLLPLPRFLSVASILIPPDRLRPDGALISRMESLPSRDLMDLLNLRVALAGKAKDLDDDGVPYDRSILRTLAPGERFGIERVPRRAYSVVGLISSIDGSPPVDGVQVAKLILTGADGSSREAPVIAGRDTAESKPPAGRVLAGTLQELHPWSWTTDGDPVEYLGHVSITSIALAALSIENTCQDCRLNVRALTLFDERDDAFTSLVLDDQIDRTTFFDMKVYEYPKVLSRAYLVHQTVELDDSEALRYMGSPHFQPRTVAVVQPGAQLGLQPGSGEELVEALETRPELVRLRASANARALLVLSDAFYPGWTVRVDGQQESLLRVDVALRGVVLGPGSHEVAFDYQPTSLLLGGLISILTVVVLVALVLPFPGERLATMMAIRRRWRHN